MTDEYDKIADTITYKLMTKRKIVQALRDVANKYKTEIKQLKANHKNMVERNALLRQRPDLPVDRIPAHKQLIELQSAVAEERQDCAKIVRSFIKPVIKPAGPHAGWCDPNTGLIHDIAEAIETREEKKSSRELRRDAELRYDGSIPREVLDEIAAREREE